MKNIATTLTALFLALGTTTSAQPGSLDDTFGNDGKVTTDLGTPSDRGNSVAIQLDGKIVVAGYTTIGTQSDFALARYNTDGTLDYSFSTDGKVTTDFGTAHSDIGMSVTIQSDGKIVVAGYVYYGTYSEFALARYNTDGTPDSSFGFVGRVTTNFGTGSAVGLSVAIQPNGNILVAGSSGGDFAVARYTTDGTLDNTFSTDGKVTTDFGAGNDTGWSVAIQPDGRIVVVGSAVIGTTYDLALARYTTDGSLDNSFSVDGKVTTDFGPATDDGRSVTIQPDGKIVVAGESNNGTDLDFALARYTTDGSLDNSFGVNGKVTTAIGTGNDRGTSVTIQPDGKIVVAGESNNGTDDDFALARYTTDGSLDNSFGVNGKETTAFGTGDDIGQSIAIQPDGSIVVAGGANNGTDSDFAVARYNTDGTLDNSFSGDGKMTTDFGTDDYGRSVAIQPDGKVVVAGYSNNGLYSDLSLARYNTDGTLDNTFSGDGKVTTDVGPYSDFGYSVAIQPDGRIIVAGGYSYFAVARFNTDGTLDNSFSDDGKVTTDIGSGEFGQSVAIQPDGRIVVAGYVGYGTNSEFAVVRYNMDGTLDNSFSDDGIVTTDFGTGDDYGYSVAIQPTRKIVVSGKANGDFALARYNTDGTLDNSFGVEGKVTTDFGAVYADYDEGWSVAIQPDGKIVVAGYAYGTFAVARYNTDGTLDNSFGVEGKVTTDFGTGDDRGYSVAIQPDGKIVVAGYAYGTFAVARYNTDGTLDNSFGVNGKVTTAFGTGNDRGYSVAIQSDGKIVVAGSSDSGGYTEFAVARYLSDLNVGVIEFSLNNNAPLIYPNPIDAHATLEYTLQNDETISIHLLDMQGKTVQTLIERQVQPAGEHRMSIDLPESLPSGTYLLAISSPKGKVTVQVVK
ncbi:MAG: T9SS type A sorting domain-containing protein [Flavobacteriales bacterium]|nr:T9SS type A sorting domain-containing protein [Flavobacteriales bacterium]